MGQMYGDKVYTYHLKQVAGLANNYYKHEIYIATAWLHDILEDTTCTEDELNVIDKDICTAVKLLTFKPKQTVEQYYNGLRTNELAMRVKFCDRLANMSQEIQYRKYTDQYPMFREILYNEDPIWNALDLVHNVNK